MKLMICVKSCQAHSALGFHNIIRGTWGADAKRLGIDVRFFMGAEAKPYQSDEVHLKCADDYNSLPYKTREICRWANGKAVDHLFLCDNDTFLIPRKMLQCGFEKYDYVGKIDKQIGVPFRYEHMGRNGEKEFHQRCFPWASGGYGYFLSRKAFQEVAYEYPMSSQEDLWVGNVMGKLFVEGEVSILNTPGNVYSWHHPQHGEIYSLDTLKNWTEQMYKEHK